MLAYKIPAKQIVGMVKAPEELKQPEQVDQLLTQNVMVVIKLYTALVMVFIMLRGHQKSMMPSLQGCC